MKPLMIKFGAVTASVTVALGAGEVALRTLPIGDELGWTRVPSLEERLDVDAAAAGEVRVLGLGDSFAEFGEGDGRNFLRVAEHHANEDGVSLSLVNLGQAGTGVKHYLHNLETYGDEVAPDVVVVALYLGNDLLDYELDLRRIEGPARFEPASGPGQDWKSQLRRRCLTVNFLFRRAKRMLPSLRTGAFEANLERLAQDYGYDAEVIRTRAASLPIETLELARADAINTWDVAFGVARPSLYTEMLGLAAESHFAQAFEGMCADLDRIRAWCETRNVRAVAVTIPPSAQVAEHYQGFYRDCGYAMGADLVGPSALDEALSAHLREDAWGVIDLGPTLRAAGGSLYIPLDTHWSGAGQELAGEAVWAELRGLLR